MKKKKLLATMLAFTIIVTNGQMVHAEDNLSVEPNYIQEIEVSLMETESDQKISYEIHNVLMNTDALTSNGILNVTVVLNTTEGIEQAVIDGFADDKGSKVHYECTSVTDTDLVFEIAYSEYDVDHYILETLELTTNLDVLTYDLEAYGDFSYKVNGSYQGESHEGINMYTSRNVTYTGVNGDDGRFVVVIDPGHDKICSNRDWNNGVWETDLNWRMAEAMKEELEKYADVEVYLNRSWEECPGVADANDEDKCLEMRIVRAEQLKADLVISMHNNAAGNGALQTYAKGALIYITQYPGYQKESEGLSKVVLSKLEDLGLKNNGIKTRYYGDDATDTYEDGTGWDYYAINRHSTLRGIPSLLIEHAFMDNAYDLELLRDDEMVKAIGKADAQAIVEYYGLIPVEESKTTGDMKIVQGEDGYVYLDITNVNASYEIESVCVSVWSHNGGEDDLAWYEAVRSEIEESEPEETEPVESESVETEPEETESVESEPMETEPEETESVESEPVETEPEETESVESELVETESEETESVENEPVGRKTVENKTNEKNEKWTVTVDLKKHNMDTGTYTFSLYYVDAQGKKHFVKTEKFKVTLDEELIAQHKTEKMYRLYNPNNGEHFYTADVNEKDYLDKIGWDYEGIGWYAPVSGDPVYRMYNPNAGDHHYTLNIKERDYLVKAGWNYEGIGWYSDTNKTVPLYRLYNPNAVTGTHHYTTNKSERNYLAKVGWNDEGIGWYGCQSVN